MLARLLATVLAPLALAVPARAQAPDADQRAVFALLDAIDPLDTTRLPFVRVTTGHVTTDALGQDGNTQRWGFLLRCDGRTFDVQCLDLCRLALVATPSGTAPEHRVAFEPADLRTAAAELSRQLRDAAGRSWDRTRSPDHPVSDDLLALLLTRACSRHGHVREAQELWELLPEALRDPRRAARRIAPVQADLLVLQYLDESRTWSDLLAGHRQWLATFGGDPLLDPWRRRVAARADALALVVAEQLRPPATARDTPAVAAALRNEVWLRARVSCPACRAQPPRRAQPRPLDRVVELGLEAAPELIDLLTDESPTRSVYFASSEGFAPVPLGRIARIALWRISGLSFPDDDQPGYRAWLERARRVGIRLALAERIAAGDATAANSYLERWPEDAACVIAALETGSLEPRQRAGLLRALADSPPSLRGPRLLALLAREATAADDADLRLVLARSLLDRGSRAGIAPILQHWSEALADATRWDRDDIGWHVMTLADLTAFLVTSGDLAAWREIEGSLRFRTARIALADCLRTAGAEAMLARASGDDHAVLRAAIERCLLRLLEDRGHFAEDATIEHGAQKVALHNVSVADRGVTALAHGWPDEYRFDPARPSRARERQIAALAESAPTRLDAPVADPRIAALVERVRSQQEHWRADLDALRALGLPALPRVRALAESLPPSHPAAAATRALVRELADLIASVSVTGLASRLPEASLAKLRAMVGKDLDPRVLLEILSDLARCEPARGVHLLAACERSGLDDGWSIALALGPATGGDRHVALQVLAGGTLIARDDYRGTGEIDAFGRWSESLARALRTSSQVGLELHIALQLARPE